ncbi:MAG: DUF167 domain-containing protein [Patescibacteria group bacterium]
MYIKLHVVADAREESIQKTGIDSYDISVKEKALQNQANRKVLDLMRKEFGEKRVQIRLVSGHHSPHKIVSVDKIL